MSDYTEATNYMLLAVDFDDAWMKDRALRRGAEEITTLRQQLAKSEARVAELERDRLKLPHDVVINGGITFRKGVALKTFIAAAERWHKQAISQHDHVDKEGLRLLFRGAERAGGEK